MDAKSRLIEELRKYLGFNQEHKVILTGIADFILSRDRQINAELVEMLRSAVVVAEGNTCWPAIKDIYEQALSQYKGDN